MNELKCLDLTGLLLRRTTSNSKQTLNKEVGYKSKQKSATTVEEVN